MRAVTIEKGKDVLNLFEKEDKSPVSIFVQGKKVGLFVFEEGDPAVVNEVEGVIEKREGKKDSFNNLLTAISEMNATKRHSSPVNEEDYYEQYAV